MLGIRSLILTTIVAILSLGSFACKSAADAPMTPLARPTAQVRRVPQFELCAAGLWDRPR